ALRSIECRRRRAWLFSRGVSLRACAVRRHPGIPPQPEVDPMVRPRAWSPAVRLLALAAIGASLPPPVRAQHPFTPGVAFGAMVFPVVDAQPSTGWRRTWAVQFDLFTELSKDLEPLPSRDFQRYNDIQHTIGVNQVGVTLLRTFDVSPFRVHNAVWLAGGPVWDGPTEFLQNDFAHGLRRLTYVPR